MPENIELDIDLRLRSILAEEIKADLHIGDAEMGLPLQPTLNRFLAPALCLLIPLFALGLYLALAAVAVLAAAPDVVCLASRWPPG